MTARNTLNEYIDVIRVSGAKAISHVLAATAVVDNGDGTVKLTASAAHGLLAGSVVYIENTDSYDGLREITAIPAAATFSIKAPFVAETTANADTVKIAIASKKDYRWLGYRIHFTSAPGQADLITVTVDSGKGSKFDTLIYTKDLDTVKDFEYINPNKDLPFSQDDILRIAWPNVDSETFGLELFYSPLV